MKIKTMFVLIMTILFITTLGIAVENRGDQNKELFGGDRGKVSFPHRLHQDKLGGCNDCHSVFPKERGAIESMKKKGSLKPKEVMNKVCIKCHKAKKQAGEKAGPLTCSKCHVK